MKHVPSANEGHVALRQRAVARLAEGDSAPDSREDPIAALQALYHLATSADTAPRALALLHELQVHQVELDLQDEELRRSRLELEHALARYMQLYDFSPVAYFSVGPDTALFEINLAAARMLGGARPSLLGRRLVDFLRADSVGDLRAAMSRIGLGAPAETLRLHFAASGSHPAHSDAAISRDPDGIHYFLALLDGVRVHVGSA